ncbi:MAG: hypothetical protein IJ231_01520 [Clostridia bacterium]|nr:hypothetical protein [Clostridia bacterium]
MRIGHTDLDQDLIASLQEPSPAPSPLSEAHLLEHAKAIREEEAAFSSQETKAHQVSLHIYRILSVCAALLIILLMLWGVMDLPVFGKEKDPLTQVVSARYLSAGLQEGGATNLVANMILDYRAFDTLGESNVLFASACAVLLLLRKSQNQAIRPSSAVDSDSFVRDPILQFGARILFPLLLLYGLYIVFNGHLGPGGGFSGGAVMGSALILYRCAYGAEETAPFFSSRTFQAVTCSALCFYALSKAYSFFTGANGLPSFISTGTPGSILSAGLILPLNIAVGLIVCSTMYAFFCLFEKGEF